MAFLCACMGVAHAQDTRLAKQALQCAVLLDALALAELGDVQQSARWQRASQAFNEVHRKALGGEAPDVHEREQLQRQLQDARSQQTPALLEHVVVCGAWAEGFLAQGTQVQYVPVYPKVIGPAVRSYYASVGRALMATR